MGTIGALLGLVLAIVLIIRRVPPAYSLMLGALVGGLMVCGGLRETVGWMIDGVSSVVPAIVRILSAGVLCGVLVVTGAATRIANSLVSGIGQKMALAGIALTTMVLCAVGVFIDVAVITMAPIALQVAGRVGSSKPVVLLAMIGGGKCGNIISANPNTIISAENYGADLPLVMAAGVVPAIVGLAFVVLVVYVIAPKSRLLRGERVSESMGETADQDGLPSLWSSLTAPLVAVVLLALRPLTGVSIDPLVALPLGGLAGLIVMRRWHETLAALGQGLKMMTPVAILLVGTGTIAGVINHSGVNDDLLSLISRFDINPIIIAPLSGILMSAATASTTAGATVASASFSQSVIAAGISPTWGAEMTNAGATVLDHLPHGSFFHATGGAVGADFKQRLRLVPYESLIGLVLSAVSLMMAAIV